MATRPPPPRSLPAFLNVILREHGGTRPPDPGLMEMSHAGGVARFGVHEFGALKVAYLLIRGRPEFVGFRSYSSRMPHEFRATTNGVFD